MPNNITDAHENALLDLSLVNGDLLALMAVIGTDSTVGTEVTGGSYARQTISWGSASGGTKSNTAAISFTTLAATSVQGWAVYDSTGTTRKWYGLISAQTGVAVAASTDVFTKASHGFTDGMMVVFQTGYVPTGLTASTAYYVRDSTSSTFKLSTTLGGTAIDITADYSDGVVGKVLDIASGGGVSIAVGQLALAIS